MKTISMKNFIRLLHKYSPSKIVILSAVTLSIIQTIISLMVPLISMNIINEIINNDFNILLILILISIFLAQMLLSAISIYMMIYIGENLINYLRKDLWNKVINFPVSFFDTNNTNEVISRITNDTSVIRNFFTDHLIPFVTGSVTIIGSIIILFTIDWQIGLVFILVFPLAYLILKPIGNKMYYISKNIQSETAYLQKDLGKVLGNIRLMKASTAEDIETFNGYNRIHDIYKYGLKNGKILSFISPVMTTTILMILVLILGFGVYKVSLNLISVGALIAIIFYIFQIMSPLTLMAQFFTQFQRTMGSTERVYHLLQEPTEQVEHIEQYNIPNSTECNLKFENVSFSYDSQNTILKNISFQANKNEKLAIVGESGAGKSTILSLIERFYAIEYGNIYYNDIPISEFNLISWRDNLAYVSQDAPIIEGTIWDNLLYGSKKDMTYDDTMTILHQANIYEFIQKLPEKLETQVGENGIKLSGGQKQRISIARALIKNPNILLLDEATAHLDNQSETSIQEVLNKIMKNKITIVVAHRISTIVDSNNILVIKDGQIVDSGNHKTLLQKSDYYNKLVQKKLQN
ncbi:ABC transporter ATP-binding protein [Staphylococcus ureilyticus]|uniref:ABC transporter ATP-binding protein n=1 Tax=Staphylococcus ureilyticus TaxID=94138 RepID=UPI00321A65BB